LRADNADERLTPKGLELGCVGAERRAVFGARARRLARALALLEGVSLTSAAALKQGLPVNQDGQRRSGFALLALPSVTIERLREIWPELAGIDPATAERIETDARYAVYLDRQQADIDAFRRDEQLALPAALDYDSIAGLSAELRGKLAFLRPRTLGQAQRIDGMTPTALTLLAARARRA
jgi:tRNA uridine 5-carboxymethylaminomethyl modification enzyme